MPSYDLVEKIATKAARNTVVRALMIAKRIHIRVIRPVFVVLHGVVIP